MNLKNLFNAEYRAVLSFRIYSFIYRDVSKTLGYIMYHRSKIKYGCDIAPTAQIGADFKIAHIGGIVIGRNAIIGDECTINNNVTLGMKNATSDAMPTLGNGVYVSTGAKLLGGISIGNDCIIGANSVVLISFENNRVIVGIPSKSVKRT